MRIAQFREEYPCFLCGSQRPLQPRWQADRLSVPFDGYVAKGAATIGSRKTHLDRSGHLRSGRGLHGKSSASADAFDEAIADILTETAGLDWLLLDSPGSGVFDTHDKADSELSTDR